MNDRMWLVVALCLAVVAPVGAQPPSQSPSQPAAGSSVPLKFSSGVAQFVPADPVKHQAAMYEDIEIMRRLLDDKLQTPIVAAQGPALSNPFDPLGSMSGMSSPVGSGGMGSPMGSTGGMPSMMGRGMGPSPVAFDFGTTKPVGVHPGSFEGVYLQGQGVLFTATMPPPAPSEVETTKPASKPLSDWERTRKQLRGEKIEPTDQERAKKKPTLTENVLKILAENGQHFGHLADQESLTVVITFRPLAGREPRTSLLQNFELENKDGTKQLGLFGYGVAQISGQGSQSSSQSRPAQRPSQAQGGQGAPGGSTGPSSARDYELLGDLHLKQKVLAEAIQAYQKAAEVEPDPQHAAALYLKIAGLLYMSGEQHEAQARQAMDRASAFLKRQDKSDTRAANPGAPLISPPKLIISASRDLLNRAGTGKISFDEFKKAATVQTLTFTPATKSATDNP
jgi:hypothetical protein